MASIWNLVGSKAFSLPVNYGVPAMNDDYYRRQADEAQVQADRSLRADDRAAWLRIAQSWLNLLRAARRPTPQEDFDDAVRDQGTHQDISKEQQ